MPSPQRKPHLLRIKKEIVCLIDEQIRHKKGELKRLPPTPELQRDLAIWIKQRNKIAREADIELMPLNNKDGQGNLIYIGD